MSSLDHEFVVIDAQCRYEELLKAEIRLLRILLRKKSGELTLKDKWQLNDLTHEFPQLVQAYANV